MLTNLLYVLLALLMLDVIVVCHELGHFLVGRACGIGVVEFAVGMGPKLLGFKRGGVEYSLRAFPIGGYCKFVGEDDDDPAPNAMNNAPVWKRFLTVLAGPMMNYLLAYVLIVVILLAFPQVVDVTPGIDTVVAGSPAEAAGLLPGDTLLEVNGEALTQDGEGTVRLREIIAQGGPIALTVQREGETLSLGLTPEPVETDSGTVYQMGVELTQVYHRNSLGEALRNGAVLLKRYSTMMLDVLRDLIFRFKGAENMAGAVGTVAIVSQELKSDLSLILDYAFIISLNLGIINLIPFPGLDGSRLLFLLIEALRRKPVPPEKEGMVHLVGLAILLVLAAVLTVHDIMTYVL